MNNLSFSYRLLHFHLHKQQNSYILITIHTLLTISYKMLLICESAPQMPHTFSYLFEWVSYISIHIHTCIHIKLSNPAVFIQISYSFHTSWNLLITFPYIFLHMSYIFSGIPYNFHTFNNTKVKFHTYFIQFSYILTYFTHVSYRFHTFISVRVVAHWCT